MIKAVLFDMDGTLVDSEKHYVLGTKKWLEEKGFEISEDELCKIIGKSSSQVNEYLGNLLNVSPSYIEKYNTEYFNETNVINYKDYLFDDVKDVLIKLKEKGIKLALCSGSEQFLIDKFIKDCHLENIFDLTISSEYLKHKPDPEVYLKAMETLHLLQEECIIVEDSYQGIKAGKATRCRVIARDASKYKINQEEADKIIYDLHELLEDIK